MGIELLAVVGEEDDGGAHRTPGVPGYGLVGMRERVELFGGELEAGPWGRGYRVRAVLTAPAPAAGPVRVAS